MLSTEYSVDVGMGKQQQQQQQPQQQQLNNPFQAGSADSTRTAADHTRSG